VIITGTDFAGVLSSPRSSEAPARIRDAGTERRAVRTGGTDPLGSVAGSWWSTTWSHNL
jgi:hypothetical protein